MQVISSATWWHLSLEDLEVSSGRLVPRQQSWSENLLVTFLCFWLTFDGLRCAPLGREMAQRRRSWWCWTLMPKTSHLLWFTVLIHLAPNFLVLVHCQVSWSLPSSLADPHCTPTLLIITNSKRHICNNLPSTLRCQNIQNVIKSETIHPYGGIDCDFSVLLWSSI